MHKWFAIKNSFVSIKIWLDFASFLSYTGNLWKKCHFLFSVCQMQNKRYILKYFVGFVVQ